MTVTAFDTLAYSNKLKLAGVDDKIADAQSEATAEILQALIIEQLSTKGDLKELEMRIYAFIVRAITTSILILTGIQTIFHFLK